MAASKLLLNNICSMSLERYSALSGHTTTSNCGCKSIFSSFLYLIVPLAGDQDGQAFFEKSRKRKCWSECRWEGPITFFQFTAIRNRFSAISWDWLGLLTKSIDIASQTTKEKQLQFIIFGCQLKVFFQSNAIPRHLYVIIRNDWLCSFLLCHKKIFYIIFYDNLQLINYLKSFCDSKQ